MPLSFSPDPEQSPQAPPKDDIGELHLQAWQADYRVNRSKEGVFCLILSEKSLLHWALFRPALRLKKVPEETTPDLGSI